MGILIPITLFVVIAFIVKWSLDHDKWKKEFAQGGSGADNSLRMSELQAMIQEAVDEANAPLLARLEDLESRLDAPPSLLDLPLDEYEAEAVPRRQRVS
jgi:hypothetical protein